MSDYEKFQLQWMIDHGHSLRELMEELQSLQYDDPEDSDQISTPITELFERWEQDRGFGSEIWPCEAEYEGCEVSIEVHGDVEIVGFMNGHDFLYKNKQNTGAMNMAASDTLRTTFKSDAELWDALNADEEAENKVAFENNSWIEAFVKDPKGHWHGSSVVDDADDVLDACGGISGWIDWLNENYIKEDKA